jgi:hypothetical protein
MKKIIIIGVLLILAGLDYVFVINPCISQNTNGKSSFSINFANGANNQDLNNFANAFKQAYPNIIVDKIMTEEDSISEAAYYNNIHPDQMSSYRQLLIDRKDIGSSIRVRASSNDLKPIDKFLKFIPQEVRKYSSLKFAQYSGSSPENIASISSMSYTYCMSPNMAISYVQHLFTKKEDAIKMSDAMARALIAMARVQAMVYNETYGSYTDLCTSSSTKGLKIIIDNMKKNNMENISCFATSTYWAISGSLKDSPNIGYCTDNNGFNTTVSVPTIATTGKCN